MALAACGESGDPDASETMAASSGSAGGSGTSTTGDPGTTAMETATPTDSTCADDCAICGDGELQPGEACDDANPDDADECPSTCEPARCGDGFVQMGVEECDDANVDSLDGCSAECVGERLLYAFVTGGRYTGALGDIGGADARCQERAAAGGLPGTYRAWLSDAGSNSPAFTWLIDEKATYLRPDRTVLAVGWSELISGMLRAPIAVNELGDLLAGAPCEPDTAVWTNTKTFGQFATLNACDSWDNDTDFFDGAFGSYTAMDAGWTHCKATLSCDQQARLYCMQQASEGCMFPDCD